MSERLPDHVVPPLPHVPVPLEKIRWEGPLAHSTPPGIMRVELTVEQFHTWVAALLDPERQQGQGCLQNREGAQCCLGVAADAVLHLALTAEDQVVVDVDLEDERLFARPLGLIGGVSTGPDALFALLGGTDVELRSFLAGLNDNQVTFPQIAWVLVCLVARGTLVLST